MKTYAEIIKLLDAGYSREEIAEMEDIIDDPGDESEQGTNDNANPSAINDAVTLALNEVRTAIEDFKKEVTAMNIINSQQKPIKETSGEEILASIINPVFDNKKGDN